VNLLFAAFFASGVGAGTGGTGLAGSTSAGCVPACSECAIEGRNTTEGAGAAELLGAVEGPVIIAAARYALPAADA
tara:strand:- start:121 stop:348 length:228 start_codon:yes stop_codon:yes gene_type:complete